MTSFAPVYIVMGVTGCGKSTVAHAIAKDCAFKMIDADDYHTLEAKELMADGIGLTDRQRIPWLARVCQAIRLTLKEHKGVVVACSALKGSYRDIFRDSFESCFFIWLKIDSEVVCERLESRHGHFAKSNLIQSQFNDLEIPDSESSVFVFDANQNKTDLLPLISNTVTTHFQTQKDYN